MHTVVRVIPGSPAFRAGVKPGDVLCAVNGNCVADVLDYEYHTYGARVSLDLGTRRVLLRKDEGQDPGLVFGSFLMDGQRSCQNRCVFCFIDQLPGGLRPSLYIKDDDARLSLLTGSYLSLTNLDENDVQRICARKISPLGISVHTTDPELRVRMLNHPRAGEALTLLRRFADHGITMNCQIVLCPGWNDGPALERTLKDLYALAPWVASVAVVPVGLTCHREGLTPLRPVTREDALDALAIVERVGRGLGAPLVLAADELYLRAGLDPLDMRSADDYPQLENGVGMLRLFAAQFREAVGRGIPDAPHTASPEHQRHAEGICAEGMCTQRAEVVAPYVIATGMAAAPFLRELLAMHPILCNNGEVIAVPNTFFGESVDVAGLLTGRDLLAALRGRVNGRRVLLPASMLRFIDGLSLAELAEGLGVPVTAVPVDGEALLHAINDERLTPSNNPGNRQTQKRKNNRNCPSSEKQLLQRDNSPDIS
jgi:putative radical SAM enzyme (TIGR03279 family)